MMKIPVEEFEAIVDFAQTKGWSETDARRQLFSYLQNPEGTYTAAMRATVRAYYEPGI